MICILNHSNNMFRVLGISYNNMHAEPQYYSHAVPFFFKERDISITYILKRSEYMLSASVFKERDINIIFMLNRSNINVSHSVCFFKNET